MEFVKDLDCCAKCGLACLTCGCVSYNKDRSYLFVRENGIEKNLAFTVCCDEQCRFGVHKDNVTVYYYDSEPFVKQSMCCGCCVRDPKLEIIDDGCMCCCMKVCSR